MMWLTVSIFFLIVIDRIAELVDTAARRFSQESKALAWDEGWSARGFVADMGRDDLPPCNPYRPHHSRSEH